MNTSWDLDWVDCKCHSRLYRRFPILPQLFRLSQNPSTHLFVTLSSSACASTCPPFHFLHSPHFASTRRISDPRLIAVCLSTLSPPSSTTSCGRTAPLRSLAVRHLSGLIGRSPQLPVFLLHSPACWFPCHRRILLRLNLCRKHIGARSACMAGRDDKRYTSKGRNGIPVFYLLYCHFVFHLARITRARHHCRRRRRYEKFLLWFRCTSSSTFRSHNNSPFVNTFSPFTIDSERWLLGLDETKFWILPSN